MIKEEKRRKDAQLRSENKSRRHGSPRAENNPRDAGNSNIRFSDSNRNDLKASFMASEKRAAFSTAAGRRTLVK